MMLFARILTTLLVLLAAATAAAVCPSGVNLEDRDGNGFLDYACVTDWNESGACEIEADIQAAADALDDPGPKTVELGACTFLPPLAPANPEALLELGSDTPLVGQGPATVLLGLPETELSLAHAVVTNKHYAAGDHGIVIRDLEIDGGWRSGDATALGLHHRMGVLFDNCHGCRVENVTVRDTLHACLYTRHGSDVTFADNYMLRCGNYTGQGYTYPCVYLYVEPGRHQSGVIVRGNVCDGSGCAGITMRREDAAGSQTGLLFEDNVVRDTRPDPNGLPNACIWIRGVRGATFRDNRCERAAGFVTHPAAAYDSFPGSDIEASSDVLVDGLVLHDVRGASGLPLLPHLENFTARRVEVDSAAHDCVQLAGPLRNVRIEDSTFRNCADWGVTEFQAAGFAQRRTRR